MVQSGAAVEPALETTADPAVGHARTHSQSVPERAEPLDVRLFLVVSVILALLVFLFVVGVTAQWQAYHSGITKALAAPVTDHAAVLSYARALDAAIVETSALFLGYLLVFTGALYVLRIATSHYRLNIKSGKNSGSLQTSSPGLVIITLGVVLIAITILTHSDVQYKAPDTSAGGQVGAVGTPDAQSATVSAPVEDQPSLQPTTPPSERK
jgi:hypothetical protein